MRGRLGHGASRPDRGCAIIPDPAARSAVHVHWRSMASDGRTCATRRPLADSGPPCTPGSTTSEFIAAHNAPFDRSVLQACCATCTVFVTPRVPFICTVQLARAQWGIYPTRLPDVCRRIRIPSTSPRRGVRCAGVCAHRAYGGGRGLASRATVTSQPTLIPSPCRPHPQIRREST